MGDPNLTALPRARGGSPATNGSGSEDATRCPQPCPRVPQRETARASEDDRERHILILGIHGKLGTAQNWKRDHGPELEERPRPQAKVLLTTFERWGELCSGETFSVEVKLCNHVVTVSVARVETLAPP